jgi:sulfur-oxidizing protein SoxY
MMQRRLLPGTTRRLFLAGAATLLVVRPAGATPETMAAAIRQVTGGKRVTPGRVRLSIPPLVENGNTVAVTIFADSPMTEKDHVTGIHLFTEKNPLPNVIDIRLGARAGKAEVANPLGGYAAGGCALRDVGRHVLVRHRRRHSHPQCVS